MKSSKFFRRVWQANAILIFVAGIMAVLTLCLSLIMISTDVYGTRSVRNVVNTDEDIAKERLSIAESERICGTDSFLLALRSDQSYQQSYYSKSASAIRNYAFVSMDGQTNWVYPHNKFLFSEAVTLPRPNSRCDLQSTKAVLFFVIKEDSNGDRRLTYKDAGTIALSRPDGAGYKEVISDATRLISHYIVRDALFLVYESSEGGQVATISLEDFSITKQTLLVLPNS